MAPAETERALIDQDETDTHFRNTEEQNLDLTNLKDTKYSWFVCCCTFLTQVFILGVLHAFGVFFVEFLKEFNSPKAQAAWVGSLAYGLSMTFGPVTSVLIRKYGYSKVMMIGGGICAISVVTSSFATSIPQLFISFSFLYGIGTCMATGPTMTITTEYFDKYLTIATGMTVSGSSFGTLIMGPLSQFIIDNIGWRNAFRIFAVLHVITIILNSQIKAPMRYSSHAAKKRSLLLDLQIWKNRVFVVWTLAITLVMFGFYIPYVHLVSYAIDQGISPDKASMLMMVLGATTFSGRLLFGKIVQIGILNRLHMHQLSMVVTGTGVMILPLITSYIGIILYVVTVGLVDGCYVVLLPILTTSLVGIENSVLAWGFLIGTSSITFTLGPPVAGALYDMTGSYDLAFHCAGIPIVAGAITLFLIPWAQRTSKQPNIMEFVNEYTASETFRMNSVHDMTRDTGAMVATIDDVVQTIALPTSSFVTVRSVGTSTDDHAFLKDESTSTCSSLSYRRRSLDIDEALSQLSRHDGIFSEMLEHSFTSERPLAKDSASPQYIPRIPPPSDPGRSYSRLRQDNISLRLSRKSGDSDRKSTDQQSLNSFSDAVKESPSQDVYIPSTSQYFSFPMMASSAEVTSEEKIIVDMVQERSDVAGVSQQFKIDDEKPTDRFDQTVSEEVGKLLETLKVSSSASEDYDMERTIVKSEQQQQIYTPAASAFEESFQSVPVAGPSHPHVSSAPQHHQDSEEHQIKDTFAHSFVAENQLTVIPGPNPFVKVKPKPGPRLEDLFNVPDSSVQTQQSSSFEILETGSTESIRQTPSTTGEIDVFKHLFDDDDDDDDDINKTDVDVTHKD